MYRRVKSQDTDSFILGCSEFFLFCFNLKKKRKKRKDGRKKNKNTESLSAQSMETDLYITKTTLVLSNTPNTNGFAYERGIHVKIWNTKRNTSTHSKISIIGTSHMYGYVLSLPYVVQ